MAHSWVTCLIHECYIIHSCPHSFICVTRRRNVLVRDLWVRIIHVCDMRVTHSCTIRLIYGLHNSSIRLIRMCYMTRLCVWHDAFLSGTRLIHLCDMAHSYMWQVSLICVTWPIPLTWLIHPCDTTLSFVWHALLNCDTQPIHICQMMYLHVWLTNMSVCDLCSLARNVWHDGCIHMCEKTHS